MTKKAETQNEGEEQSSPSSIDNLRNFKLVPENIKKEKLRLRQEKQLKKKVRAALKKTNIGTKEDPEYLLFKFSSDAYVSMKPGERLVISDGHTSVCMPPKAWHQIGTDFINVMNEEQEKE